MKVRVKAYGFIAQKLGNIVDLELEKDATVAVLISKLSRRLRGFDLAQEIILVDGKAARLDKTLHDGAEVTIMPAIVGG